MNTKTLLAVLLTTCLMPAAALMADGPLPTGPNVVAGDITITNPAPTQLLVRQSGAAGIVDWGSFSIGAGNGVQFNNGTGATLNRVTGGNLSSIMGTLDATGSVYLINRNGIVFGESGVVNTGGTFVASTLDIANQDFLAGGDDVFAGGSDAYVINLGRISALGGDVALLGRNVVNEGTIAAPDGTVGLVAGREILMRDASLDDGLFSVRIGGRDSSVTEAGAIQAAAAELRANGGNVYALAGNTDGTIAATGVASVKGRIFLTAGDGGRVQVDKAVKATGAAGKGGKITVSGGMVDMAGLLDVTGTSGGEVRITSAIETVFSGRVLAFGTGAVGTGGFVEVSGLHLTYDGTVDTGGGTVLIDPENIEITDGSARLSGASVLTTTEITSLLSTGDLIIQTTGGAAEAGTIVVSSTLSVASPFVLTLLAHGDILANASIQVGDSTGGGLNLVAGWDGSTSTVAFDAAVFDGADLATQTIFGNATGILYQYDGVSRLASGSVFIADGSQNSGVAVGSLLGDTRVYGNDLVLTGSQNGESFYAFAQLGYNVTGIGAGFDLNSPITVRATGDVSVLGGTSGNAVAQIGNIGLNADEPSLASLVSSTAAISIEALGDLVVQGGQNVGFTYAMIGNGSKDDFSTFQTLGDRSGDITITVGGEISIARPTEATTLGWIGHQTQSGTFENANIFLTAAAFDFDAGADVGSGGTGSLDIAMVADNLLGGNFSVTATDSSLALSGTTAQNDCECDFIVSASDLVIQASGDIHLEESFFFSNTGGGDVALAARGAFANSSGADAFGAIKGRWLVYSTRPDLDIGGIGVMDARFIRYSTEYDPASPFGVANVGNGFVFAVQPVIEVADATTTYGGTLVLPGVQMTVDGVVVDAADFGLSLDGTFLDLSEVTVSPSGFVNAGVYATALDANLSIVTPSVTLVGGFLTEFGQLTVDRLVVTGAIIARPTKVYDGTNIATLTELNFALTGFIADEGATVTQTTGRYASANANAFGLITVSARLAAGDFAAESGTLLANYVLPTTVTGNGVITQATITGSIIGAPTKVFDGTTLALLTSENFALTGFVAGEGATVAQGVGSYASANASGTNVVTVMLANADFAADSGTLLANYVLPTTVTGNGVILQAEVTGSIIGVPTKVYDGSTLAALTSGNFVLTGFIAGDGATVSRDVGEYASANASGTNLVTAVLAGADFVADEGTVLANYVLPTSVTGNGVISQAEITGSIIGAPTKVYDATTFATLTSGNFVLTGFIAGEGATVAQDVGAYASANASGTNLVTVVLANADFVADEGTVLANYVLPTSVTGNGVISLAEITGSIIGVPTKVYDGTTLAALTSGNFALSGFVAGEGATVAQDVGEYASANASGTNLVTVVLVGADFVADDATVLANYVLPTSVAGNGVINRAQLFVSIGGVPTKPFDGTDVATLTAADFVLSGFVAGEGATITETEGSYTASGVGAGNTVTVALTNSDYVADSSTLLSNYILPNTASGPGLIGNVPLPQPAIPAPRGLLTFATTPLGEPAGPALGLELISTETTQRIMDEINAGTAFCKALVNQEYVIDCLSDRLQAVADGLSAVGEYAEVRAALEDAAEQLHALVLSNASDDLARTVARAAGQRSSRALTAISTAALGAANAQAAAIIDGARLVLLRSSSGSERRSVAFTEVAQVVNSTKVLLRSS